MSKISLSVLAAAKGEIHVHVEIVEGAGYGTSFDAAQIAANLSSFERHFQISPSSRRDAFGHTWTRVHLMKAWREAEEQRLDQSARAAFETAFANGCVWEVVNDPGDPDAARGKILARMRAGHPAHVRAIADAKGNLCCRILDGGPGDPDDVEWMAAKRVVEPRVEVEKRVPRGWSGVAMLDPGSVMASFAGKRYL